MKRAIKIVFNDGTESKELILSKATAIKTNQQMINLEQMQDGSWRLIYNEQLINDFSKVEKLEIVRED